MGHRASSVPCVQALAPCLLFQSGPLVAYGLQVTTTGHNSDTRRQILQVGILALGTLALTCSE